LVFRLVYCSKCGAENEDDATVCKNCGATLSLPSRRRYLRRSEDEICFGFAGTPVIALLFGLLIVFWGLTSLLVGVFRWSWGNIWPLFVIALGLLIVIGNLSKR
jgi:ribosomal protein L40E